MGAGWARLKVVRRRESSPDPIRSTVNSAREKRGQGERREEERENERKRRKKKKRREKKIVWVCSGFQNSNLYPFHVFVLKFCFYIILVVFSIFNNYNAKINFQVTIYKKKITDQKFKIDFIFMKIFS